MLVKGWPRHLTFCVPPVASLYAAALAACCAGIQCHQVFLNRPRPTSSCTLTLPSPFFLTVLLHTTAGWR
jgi:hypothetical protein